MNHALKSLIKALLNRNIIGNKHIPEHLLTTPRIKHLSKAERKIFEEEYKQLINEFYFIRLKKRTGKGSEWHISLNPEKSDELSERVNLDET